MKYIHVFTNEVGIAIIVNVFNSLTKKCESVCTNEEDVVNDPKLIKYLPESFVRSAIEQRGFYFNKQVIIITPLPIKKLFYLQTPTKSHFPVELLEEDYELIY